MRQEIKDKKNLEELIILNSILIENGLNKLKENKVNPEMINFFKKSLMSKKINNVVANYTLGSNVPNLQEELTKVLDFLTTG